MWHYQNRTTFTINTNNLVIHCVECGIIILMIFCLHAVCKSKNIQSLCLSKQWQNTFTDLVDEFLGRVWHEDTITPGRTASVHVLSGFSVLFTVGVAERNSVYQIQDPRWDSTAREWVYLLNLPGWKLYGLFLNNIIEGSGFLVILQKLRNQNQYWLGRIILSFIATWYRSCKLLLPCLSHRITFPLIRS